MATRKTCGNPGIHEECLRKEKRRQKRQWVLVTPGDYDLEDIASSVERCTSVQLETGLRVQVLRAVTLPSKDKWAVKRALVEDGETWADAVVTGRGQYVYVALYNEEWGGD